MITLKNLTIKVNDKVILKNINYSFKKNNFYAIMGPNGSGKSTLAYAIAGHPNYILDKNSKIFFEDKDITDLEPDKKAQLGIFLSFQNPLSLTGVSLFQLLRLSLSGKIDPLKLKNQLDKLAKRLHIKEDLISRSLNDGASGGEKKKIELIQVAILKPTFLILDEIDTGVDVDALKVISDFLISFKKNRTIVIITHYNRILKYLSPDKVLVLFNGGLVDEGDKKLAEEIEKSGYKKYLT